MAHAGRSDRGGLRHRTHCLRAALGDRPVPDADVVRAGLGPRDLLLRHRHSEPALGRGAAIRRQHRRPFRPGPRAVGRRHPLRHRSRRNGERHVDGDARSLGRRHHRLRAGRLLVPDGDRRARQARAGRLARLCLRRRHGVGLVRPVPLFAARPFADRGVFLADRADDLRRHLAAGAAAVARAGDAARSSHIRASSCRPASRR